MKIGSLKEYRELEPKAEKIHDYLRIDLTKSLREVFLSLNRINFADNFNSFTVEATIPAGQELAIRNNLKSRETPAGWIRVRGNDGSKDIVDGDTPWNQDFVYLKNVGASSATLSVVFFR